MSNLRDKSKSQSVNQHYYDEHTLYIDSGVATKEQISKCLQIAIQNAEEILGKESRCKYKVNLLVNKDGEYFGYGYIWISSSEIYWMLLGRNPDGTERIEEFPDPDWKPPEREKETVETKNWFDIVEQEDSFVQPTVQKKLPPLVTLSGYPYNKEQIEHLKELDGEVPKEGFFEISRGYAIDSPPGTMRNRLCARNIPDWIPVEAFKSIFSFYVQDGDYPMVNFVNPKKGGKIVFITFDPSKTDALFTLLMTKKTTIINPQNPEQKTVLIFTHAYDNSKR